MSVQEQKIDKLNKKFDMGLLVRLFVLIVLIVVLTLINKNFLGAYNISTLLNDIGLLLVMSMGTTFVLLIGSIDLSLGAIVSCSAVILALLMPNIGVWAYFVVAGFGMLAGIINGLIFVKIKIPSFITTLGTMSIYTSLALILSNATPLQIGSEFKGLISWANMKFGVVPIIIILALFLMSIFWTVQTRSKFGKYCFAIGANEKAARMAGVGIDRNKILVFMIAGLCFAFAGIILTARLKSGIPSVGNSYTLMSIAAVAFGGTSLAGGKGGVLNTLLGSALIIVITNGMIVIGIDSYWQQITYGIIIIVSLSTTVDRKNKNMVVK